MKASQTFRDVLRKETRASHDSLDAVMAPLALGSGYTAFLAAQLSARRPIEAWLSENAAAGWCPPPQAPLIAADIRVLGGVVDDTFESWPEAPQTDAFLGVAWAIAGSSLGNRAMLVRRQRLGFPGADRFLSDPAMPAYWHTLLPLLERPAAQPGADAALAGAEAVFAQFARWAAIHTEPLAA